MIINSAVSGIFNAHAQSNVQVGGLSLDRETDGTGGTGGNSDDAVKEYIEIGEEGCTPGFWRQSQHYGAWQWTAYEPGDDYKTVFGIGGETVSLRLNKNGVWSDPAADSGTSSDPTLLGAAWAKGGDENALARHAVAGLLNASSGEVAYAFSVDQIKTMVQEAYAGGDFNTPKNLLAEQNEMGCPTNGKFGPVD